MVVYVVTNRIVDGVEKTNLIGVYKTEEHVNSGWFNIFPMVVGQTVLNVEV